MRQDAVMEQVFELCNQVLRRDRGTRRRGLCIRTYKVVPLATQAGLLEFVNNTIPMSVWLTNAHRLCVVSRFICDDISYLPFRYNPTDMTPSEGASKLRQISTRPHDKAFAIHLFKEVRKRFRPVLRHFFTERHKVPLAWFETRLNYSRSAATTSIIGHILGLGDRHISNILLDQVTGEVVHIDLGIAFEQVHISISEA